jgi:hypothetical protein
MPETRRRIWLCQHVSDISRPTLELRGHTQDDEIRGDHRLDALDIGRQGIV